MYRGTECTTSLKSFPREENEGSGQTENFLFRFLAFVLLLILEGLLKFMFEDLRIDKMTLLLPVD